MSMTVACELRSRNCGRSSLALGLTLGAIVLFLGLSPADAFATRLCLQPLALPFSFDDERIAIVEEKVLEVYEPIDEDAIEWPDA